MAQPMGNRKLGVLPIDILTFTGDGGAGRATFRIIDSLAAKSISRHLDLRIIKGNAGPFPIPDFEVCSAQNKAWRRGINWGIDALLRGMDFGNRDESHSAALFPTGNLRNFGTASGRLTNIHWVGSEMLSIGEISRLRGPVTFTLHDEWALHGSRHYDYQSRARFFDLLERLLELRRKHLWARVPIRFIAPSRWIAGRVRESFGDLESAVDVIPYPINTEFWRPLARNLSAQYLGVDPRYRYILFGSATSEKNARKGFDSLGRILARLRENLSGYDRDLVRVLVLGPSNFPPVIEGFPIHSLGWSSDSTMRMAFSVSEVSVVPSRMDNLPLIGMEPLACETPVVGFSVGGMNDLVLDEMTGFLAKPYDFDCLANLLGRFIVSPGLSQIMGREGRTRARTFWSPETVAKATLQSYSIALHRQRLSPSL